ncbi:PREDICTED: transmembrane protein 126A-like [Priapulus caudatus]|uniref:Transmembrane protein 126A-like n=1 Tax=Priapulus caudatus TaxID=37621 RepID=A0ABM1E1P0_PRICU|nr:PREDICTED: transmembrane protein 126A-like [Priapulus caudatus]XP_014666119.1 PREDICTED: transmembrane protein 126A-like [Priapulus caudatus]
MFSRLPRYFDSVAERAYDNDMKGVKLISREEARAMQRKFIHTWRPEEDTRPFRYGTPILAVLSSLGGILLQAHYRKAFLLGSHGLISTYLPAAALPGITTGLFQYQFVTMDILTGATPCPTCVEIRSATYQLILGIIYPMVLTPVAAAFVAGKYYTYPIPEMRQYKSVIDLWRQTTFPLSRPLALMAGIQIAAALMTTYKQGKAMDIIQEKILKMEREEGEPQPFVNLQIDL